jgi:S-formylglutathione hydrolase
MKALASHKNFGGWTKVYQHFSESCRCDMTFAVYIPPQAEYTRVPVLYWLSGLTCTHENFITKAGAQAYAAKLGILLVVPDTSPRGVGIKGEDDSYDLGTGAGFYINAIQAPWVHHYRMEDYCIYELPKLIETHFPVLQGQNGISGHSMGGHGALTLTLKYPGRFLSVSAFAPIYAPTQCAWGQKAFSTYLGHETKEWKHHDANELIQQTSQQTKIPILIDQGTEDTFLEKQLNFATFKTTCEKYRYPATLRLQKGYDHSYYFIASFIEEHLAFHRQHLV